VRSDRQVTVSGQARASVDAGKTEITGELRVDQARIVLPEQNVPTLGDDVTVRNLPQGVTLRAPRSEAADRPVRIAVNITLGDDVRVQGRGVDTRLRGELAVTGESLGEPRLNGVIRTSQGVYAAYSQRLDIERGVLRFTGPLDNPALDVLAIRPNLTQKVGVQISGRAQSPVVRLYAEPDLSDAEKLSWLVLGRASATGGAEAALLQEAAVALLTQRAGGTGGGIAGRLGLDELSLRRDSAQGAAITLGKRFANNFYAAYERTLSGALGTLYVFYDLSRRVTVRAQAGDRSGVDLIYTLTFN
ncbi:MAG TPA: translocation/assembly module TamB domain-containing protein, partial [Ramlibacter sp.]|nr:translocation/assembly module TamB domain-containing protein [Ramlibacter sp.]